MLNEYYDLELECMQKTGFDGCDPLGAFKSPENLTQSMLAIVAMYVGCYMIAWAIMIKLSTKYE